MTVDTAPAQKKGTRIRYLVAILLIIAAVIVGWLVGGGTKVKEAVAFVYGVEEYIYGYPLVMMDVTKDVLTAAPSSGQYSAPMNQFARIRTYVNPDFDNVVRISVNSLWSHGFCGPRCRTNDRVPA